MLVEFGLPHIYIGLAALAVILIILWKLKKSLSYMFFFAMFWVYLIGVVSVVVFPFFIPESATAFSEKLLNIDLNVIPLNFGNCFNDMPVLCFRGIYENILLTIPFGFGISFILHIKQKNIIWLAFAVGFVFEVTQLILLFVYGGGFRSVDINDIIFNATGVLLGYGIFRFFGTIYLFVIHKTHIQPRYIFAYINDIVRNPN